MTCQEPVGPVSFGWTGRMTVRCVQCGRDYGEKPCVPSMDGSISHAVCPDCLPAFRLAMKGGNDADV